MSDRDTIEGLIYGATGFDDRASQRMIDAKVREAADDVMGLLAAAEARGYQRAVDALRANAGLHSAEGNTTGWAVHTAAADYLEMLAKDGDPT